MSAPSTPATPPEIHDFAPQPADLRAEVLAGLRKPQKELSCKLLYDAEGSRLFDEITTLDEYYPTRTELGILQANADEMVALIGQRTLLIEYGSGSGLKTRILLDHLADPAGYVPIDISREALAESSAALATAYPGLPILPVLADYTRDLALPAPDGEVQRRVAFFPGSTIGNFDPEPAEQFLHAIAETCGPGGGLLIGVDLRKDPLVLHHAYNDRREVTAAFNLNLLAHVNRDLGADFNLDGFRHYACYNPIAGRIEMHLVSLAAQQAQVAGEAISFERGESIWTESSYKYSLAGFAALAERAGWRVERVWTDSAELFSVQYLTVASPPLT
jgi:dimethylhistidine N-methyltransferase